MKMDDGVLLAMFATELHRNGFQNTSLFDAQKLAFAIRRLLDETVPGVEPWVYEATVYDVDGKKNRAVGVVHGADEDSVREQIAERLILALPPNQEGAHVIVNRQAGVPVAIVNGLPVKAD